MPDSNEEWWYSLRDAIVSRACIDYQEAIKNRRLYYWDEEIRREAEYMIRDCESFFRGKWFAQLTTLDPEWLIRKLKEEECPSLSNKL